jgi:hypothetical protein
MTTHAERAREVPRSEPTLAAHITPESERQFLAEMTALSQKYRLGIAGEASVFIMEWDDDGRKYACDDDGKLSFR